MSLLSDDIYTLVSRDGNIIVIELADATHPVFKAHFPSNPLLPGYMQIDILATLLQVDVCEVVSAKFMKIVRPKERLTFTVSYKNTQLRATITDSSQRKVSALKLLTA